MKRVWCLLYISAVILTAIGCSSESIPSNEIIVPNNNIICLKWGASTGIVKELMRGYTVFEQTDDRLIFLYPDTNKCYIAYLFNEDKLCTSMILSRSVMINGAGLMDEKEYLGDLNGNEIYINEENNILMLIQNNDEETHYIAFTPLN